MAERRSIPHRLARRFFALPDPVLVGLTGMGAPIERDGRILNRRIQAMLALSERLGVERNLDSVETRRAELSRLAEVGMPVRTGVHVVERVIDLDADEASDPPASDGRASGTRRRAIRVYRRHGILADAPGILYLHGGGWASGDLATHDACCRMLADESGCIVVAVDYRLAPEHPFPSAVDDACAAYRWFHRHATELGVARGRVGVMGDSAGGNLAAVVAQQFAGGRDDIPAPVAQCLIYPAVDARLTSPSIDSVGDRFFLTRDAMVWFLDQYAPAPDDRLDARLSPLLATDLSGLAPAIVATAGFDPLRDEGMAYATALREAGVPVLARCYDDLVHGFFGMGMIPEALAAGIELCWAMGEVMHGRRLADEPTTPFEPTTPLEPVERIEPAV